jgi:hypothetical protein
MEKKKTKKKEPQVIEIHIYVHQDNHTFIPYNPPNYYPNGTPTNPYQGPIVTC